jgi:hypothetical protein
MRRHAFRPAGPDPLEGRLAPAAVSPLGDFGRRVSQVQSSFATANANRTPIQASNINSAAAISARAARVAHAKAVARSKTSSSINIDKIADQVKTFFFGHSKTTTHAPVKPKTPASSLLRS